MKAAYTKNTEIIPFNPQTYIKNISTNISIMNTPNDEIILKKLRKLKNPMNIRKKTYKDICTKYNIETSHLNYLIMTACSERIDGLVL